MPDQLSTTFNIPVLIRELYEHKTGLGIEQYQRNVLSWLRGVIDYDAAYWTIQDKELLMRYFAAIDHVESDVITEWNSVFKNDRHILGLFSSARKAGLITLNSNSTEGLMDGDCFSYYQHHYGIRQVMLSAFPNTETEAIHLIGLARKTVHPAFTEAERTLLETLSPHLLIAWNLNSRLYLNHATSNSFKLPDNIALTDKSGLLHQATTAFCKRLALQWPQWQGPLLPQEVCRWLGTLSGNEHHILKLNRLRLSCTCLDDVFLLQARELNPLDTLTRREHAVAKLFSEGFNYKEIAKELAISPSTVRNHLNKVYIRLGINNKIQIAQLFQRLS